MTSRPPETTLFPYTTLFRSNNGGSCKAGSRCSGSALGRDRRATLGSESVAVPRRTFCPISTHVLGAPNGHYKGRSEEHTSELQSLTNLVCRLLLENKKANRL